MKAFFKTPSGYVFMAIFIAASGFLFSFTCLRGQTTDVSSYFVMLMFAYVILIPLLTMKSFAEERRQGTEQLLLTSPVSVVRLVAAKFLACFTMFMITMGVTLFYLISYNFQVLFHDSSDTFFHIGRTRALIQSSHG